MKLIDKDALVAEIKKLRKKNDAYDKPSHIADVCYEEILSLIDTIEMKEVIAEQECTCNEALNRIIGGSWNLLCPVNKLGLKTGDKVEVIIKAQKGE